MKKITPKSFEEIVKKVMGKKYGVNFNAGRIKGVPKKFDLVSSDEQIVGDAKYYTMVKGEYMPPAKFSVIAEYVWLLEKTSSMHKFLVFGNDERVPAKWLRKYGKLVKKIKFYFVDNKGNLKVLKKK